MKTNAFKMTGVAFLSGITMFSSCKAQAVSGSVSGNALGGETIEYAEAKRWIYNYENTRGILKSKRKNGASATFRKDFIESLLESGKGQSEVAGMRIYIALDDKNEGDDTDKKRARIIIMPTDKDGNDLPYKKEGKTIRVFREYLIGTSEVRCPNNCDNDILNRGE